MLILHFGSVDRCSSTEGTNDVFLTQSEASALNSSKTITLIPPADIPQYPRSCSIAGPRRGKPVSVHQHTLKCCFEQQSFPERSLL